jgi:AcrR family transcriptional regulator
MLGSDDRTFGGTGPAGPTGQVFHVCTTNGQLESCASQRCSDKDGHKADVRLFRIEKLTAVLFTLHNVNMTSQQPNPRGRPRDSHAREAVLDATLHIVSTHGISALSLETISRQAQVSRPTLYRWWSSKGEILLEALLKVTAQTVAYGHSNNLAEDLRQHAYEYVALLTGPYGNAYRAVFAEGLASPEFLVLIRSELINPRRDMTKKRLLAAVAASQLRADTDLDVLTDALYAPFFYRLLLQHQTLDRAFADTLISQILKGQS